MKFSNILLGKNVEIETSTTINNVDIKDNVKIAKNCSIFGSANNLLEIGQDTYIGMNTIINGFDNKVIIGECVSIAQNVNIMSGSGPNASLKFQKIFPIIKGEVVIGNHTWLGASVIIMPNVRLGQFCVVAANSFVNSSFPDYCIIGGTPAKLIRKLSEEEIDILNN